MPSLAEHTVLVVMLFNQQCGVGTLALATFPRGCEEALCPQLPVPLFPVGEDLAGSDEDSDFPLGGMSPSCLSQSAGSSSSYPQAVIKGPWVRPQGIEARVALLGPACGEEELEPAG